MLTNYGKNDAADTLALLHGKVLLDTPVDLTQNESMLSHVPPLDELYQLVKSGKIDASDHIFVRICLDFHEALLSIQDGKGYRELTPKV